MFAFRARHAETAHGSYDALRRHLGRCILLGLEVLIVADIVRTIIVETTLESVAVLGIIVVIRILLSFALEVEIDGLWPWRRWQLAGSRDAGTTRAARTLLERGAGTTGARSAGARSARTGRTGAKRAISGGCPTGANPVSAQSPVGHTENSR